MLPERSKKNLNLAIPFRGFYNLIFMKGKFYTISIVGILGLAVAGFFAFQDNYKAKYQSKDYSDLLISQGDATGGMLYRQKLLANENGEIDLKQVMKVRAAVNNHYNSKDPAEWIFFEELGPNFVGGRSRAIIQDNRDGRESVFYAGGVSGGVFISYDGGNQWFTYSGNMDNWNVSDLAQTADGNLWVATGPYHDNGPPSSKRATGGFIGNGLYRRIGGDAEEYERIIGPDGEFVTNDLWTWTNRIIGHPTDANKLYVGTWRGLQVSADAAADQPTFFNGIEISPGIFANGVIHDIDIVDNGDGTTTIYATSGTNIVYKLLDKGGDDITLLSQISLPAGNSGSPQWPSISVAPSDPNYIYVSQGSSEQNNCTHGIFQSKDAGETWTNIARGGAPTSLYQSTFCQGFFDNDIAVYPNDPGKIIVGGVSIYRWIESSSNPGTGSWYKIALMQTEGTPGGLTDTNWVHADKHRVYFTDSMTVYVATDGGIHRSIDGGNTWGMNNNGFNAYQCYSIAAAFGSNLDSIGLGTTQQVMGGSQDNGTVLIGTNPNQPDRGFDLSSGDGGDCYFSNIANLAFISSQRGSLRRASFTAGVSGMFDDETASICASNCGNFVTTLGYWETAYADYTYDSIQFKTKKGETYQKGDSLIYMSRTNSIPMYFPAPRDIAANDSVYVPDYAQSKLAIAADANSGASGVYITREALHLDDITTNWDLVTDNTSKSYPDRISGNVWKIRFSGDGNQMFVGTNNGRIYRVDNLNQGYDSLTLDINSPRSVVTTTLVQNFGGGIVSGLSVDPNDPEVLVVSFAGYGGSQKVFRITNAASCLSGQGNGVSIHGDLPSGIPVYSCLIADHDNSTVMVGTEYGVYTSDNATNNAASWSQAYGLPRIPTYAMVQQTNQYLWGDNGPQFYENANYRKVYIGTHGRGYWTSSSLVGIDEEDGEEKIIESQEDLSNLKIYPNPMNETGFIEVELKEDAQVNIQIFDLSGKLVSNIENRNLRRGNNKIQFNAGDFRNGTYIASVQTADEVKVAKFVVMK